MEIKFNVTGSERKRLVNAISEILGASPKYKGAPTFAYDINGLTVDKDGTLILSGQTESEITESLIGGLESRGFTPKTSQDKLVIEVPKADFTETALVNLHRLVESKGNLIKKAIGADNLEIEDTDSTLRFPWFYSSLDADEVKAYTNFVTALCDMAKTLKRVTAVAKASDNEKYAFRCFLLRLGFIGDEYKSARKILLSKLTGSSAFKSGTRESQEVGE